MSAVTIAAEAVRLGIGVYRPVNEGERYDMIFDMHPQLLRVQCKWGSGDGETIQVRLTSAYHSPTRGYVTRTYTSDEVDAIAPWLVPVL